MNFTRTAYPLFICFVCLLVLSLSCSVSSTDLPLLRPPRDAFVEEADVLEMGVGISPFSDGLRPSLMDTWTGPRPDGTGSWITMTSSLLCWPRCSLAKSKPLTVGACSWRNGKKRRNEWINMSRKLHQQDSEGGSEHDFHLSVYLLTSIHEHSPSRCDINLYFLKPLTLHQMPIWE